MTDPIADGEIKDAGNHSEASLVPEVVNTGAHEAEVPDTAMEGARNQPARQPSKEITLQRLTPHSSWEDIVSNESAAREKQFTAAPSESGSRRLSIAAIVAIAAAVGAIGGALATAGVGHLVKGDQTAAVAAASAAEQARSLEGAIGKINADIAALKSSSAAQSAKIVDRIDRVEKAQAEPAAKLAKLMRPSKSCVRQHLPWRRKPRGRSRPQRRSRTGFRLSKAGRCAMSMTARQPWLAVRASSM